MTSLVFTAITTEVQTMLLKKKKTLLGKDKFVLAH